MKPVTTALHVTTLTVFLISASVCARAADTADWHYTAGIYGWLPNIDIELQSGTKSKITQDDIISDLDMVFQGVVRAARGPWAFSTDIIYFDLSNDDHENRLELLNLRKITLQQALLTPNVGYRFLDSSEHWTEVYAGARYVSIKATLEFRQNPPLEPRSFNESEKLDHWDGVLGLRGEYTLAANWFLAYEADIGTGQSDFVTNLLSGIGYRFGNLDAVAAYRYLHYDYGNNWVLKTETPSGPLVGVVYRF
jgi:hypothetical protein